MFVVFIYWIISIFCMVYTLCDDKYIMFSTWFNVVILNFENLAWHNHQNKNSKPNFCADTHKNQSIITKTLKDAASSESHTSICSMFVAQNRWLTGGVSIKILFHVRGALFHRVCSSIRFHVRHWMFEDDCLLSVSWTFRDKMDYVYTHVLCGCIYSIYAVCLLRVYYTVITYFWTLYQFSRKLYQHRRKNQIAWIDNLESSESNTTNSHCSTLVQIPLLLLPSADICQLLEQ